MATTADHGSTLVVASKKRCEAQGSNEKVIAAHGSPIPFLRKGSRDQLFKATGTRKLPTLKLPDGEVISHSKAILAWVREQQEQGNAPRQIAA
jgi:glutathione S-transferase